MVRIISSYAALLAPEKISLARCAELMWVRLQGRDPVNLLFSVGDEPHAITSASDPQVAAFEHRGLATS